MAIDANAMYRAGFGSKSTGRDVARDERNERLNAITKTAFNVLGQAAIGQIKQNYRGLQEYRNASDSQTSLLNLQVDKMPASSGDYYVGENESLKGSILELKSLYDAAARKASFGIGKGRNKGRQDMARYMKQLSDMNAVLEIYKTSREKSKAMLGVLSGVTNSDEGVKTISSGSNAYETDNTTQQATGALGARLRWNIETGEMEVQVGGEWGKDEEGRNVYKDKAETGTYEEYVADNQEMKNKGFEKFKAENVNSDGMVTKVQSYEDWEKKQGEDIQPMSREDWTKQNQQNRGAVSTMLYKNLKFAVEADGMMADTMRGIKSDILKASYRANAVSWERVSEIYYGELQSKIGGYNDDQFKDYYFGGDTFDHSSGRMSESAPAYQRLLAEDENDGTYKNGVFAEGYGPGSADWEGRLLALKGQSFVKGSFYRKEATDKIFKNFEKQYKENVAAYKTDNPERTNLPNVKANNTWVNGEDYNNAYGPNSPFMLFVNDETELAENEVIEYEAPSGKRYQRRSDGIYEETSIEIEIIDGVKTAVSKYETKVSTDYMKRMDNVAGTTKKTLPIVNGDNGGEDSSGVPLMSFRGLMDGKFSDHSDQAKILDNIRTTYKDYPKFTFKPYSDQLLVISPTGEKKYINMDRKFGGNNASSKELQAFVALHSKTESK